MILCLETATNICSVALCHGDELLALREGEGQNVHSERVTIFINEVLEEASVKYADLDAVAVSMGPGSYTGLRIGVSTAKGVCYAADKPLMAIDTLHAMAYGAKQQLQHNALSLNDLLVPMIDARRMEVYCSIFDSDLNRIHDTEAKIIDGESFSDLYVNQRLWLFGDGAEKCATPFNGNDNIRIISGFKPSARYMAALATIQLQNSEFVDVAYFEPFYLKDFVAGKPHVKGL